MNIKDNFQKIKEKYQNLHKINPANLIEGDKYVLLIFPGNKILIHSHRGSERIGIIEPMFTSGIFKKSEFVYYKVNLYSFIHTSIGDIEVSGVDFSNGYVSVYTNRLLINVL